MISDAVSSRRRWLAVLLGGLGVGYLVLSALTARWPLAVALPAVLVTSLFAQAGNGAVYAIVPLVRKQASGQIAGMCGAYGNVGGILFLTVLVFASPEVVFAVMGLAGLVALLACRWLVEPTTSHATAAVSVTVADTGVATGEPVAGLVHAGMSS
jgi:NNP family nitrate/nitrite transporter-like MFS transporter